jgi:hypothetical protein
MVVAFSAGNLCAIAQRGARATKPSRCLQVEPVDLVDDAVDVVAEAGALGLDRAVMREQRLDALAARFISGLDREAPAREGLDHAELRRRPAGRCISPQA